MNKTILLLFLGTLSAFSQNFINGNFESGYTGFDVNGSGYTMIVPPYSGTTASGNYSLTTDPYLMNTSSFISGGDHTTGTGNMLVIDGNSTGGQQRFYRAGNSGIGVNGMIIGKKYRFSYWVKSVSSTVTNLATQSNIGIQFNNAINVTLLSGSKIVPLPAVGWSQVAYQFLATNTTVNIELWNDNTSFVGNDFAIDDLSLVLSLNLTYTSKNPSCTTSSDGEIQVTAADGLSPYTYVLTGPKTETNTTGLFKNLPIGTYAVNVTDSGGNSDVVSNIILSSTGSTAKPVVITPQYYCQNSVATALTATALPGATLNWYGTNATGGVASPTAPMPPTNTVGITTYYVSQTIGTCESARSAIDVNVSADTGATFLLFCDGANATPTSVAFDWNNPIGYLGYYYSYSIAGGPPVTGFQVSPSHFNVPVSAPGTPVEFTILSVKGLPCIPSVTKTCNSTCTSTVTPDFPKYGPICFGSVAPILPNTSINGIIGTWSPAIVSNTATGTYNFTPDPNKYPCAVPVKQTITVTPLPDAGTLSGTQNICVGLTTTFKSTVVGGVWNSSDITIATVNSATGLVTGVAAGTATMTYTVNGSGGCTSNAVSTRTITVTAAPISGVLSGNQSICVGKQTTFASTVAGGTWSSTDTKIATVNATTGVINGVLEGTTNIVYTVSGSGGCSNVSAIRTITVNKNILPTFTSVAPICSGSVLNALPTTSLNGITGSWSPVLDNTATTTYTFTPTVGLCATTTTMSIIVNPNVVPIFASFAPVCQNSKPPVLPTSSDNNPPIKGTWSPIVSTVNAGTTIYTFTPNSGQCVANVVTTMQINVVATTTPNFAPIPDLCSGKTAPTLSNTSPNGVEGTWSPTVINNTVSGTYLFTPNPDQCATTQKLTVKITPRTNPNFQIASFCVGFTAPTLPTTSPNGITGTWQPAVISNTQDGTYVFTPNANECANTQTITITLIQPKQPNFKNIAMCYGTTAPILQNTSPNGISGTWQPATIDNTVDASYLFTPNVNECAITQTIDVLINQETLKSVTYEVTSPFSEKQVITVLALDAGNYLYQLDNGPLQTSNVFEEVTYGSHSLKVVDVNGCSKTITVNGVMVIGYPKFFTPNGDGYNDTWNIYSLSENQNAKIYIFDRQGKLLKEIKPNGTGWDGSYNGKNLPSTDYWFTVEYTENNTTNTFKSHFTLKR